MAVNSGVRHATLFTASASHISRVTATASIAAVAAALNAAAPCLLESVLVLHTSKRKPLVRLWLRRERSHSAIRCVRCVFYARRHCCNSVHITRSTASAIGAVWRDGGDCGRRSYPRRHRNSTNPFNPQMAARETHIVGLHRMRAATLLRTAPSAMLWSARPYNRTPSMAYPIPLLWPLISRGYRSIRRKGPWRRVDNVAAKRCAVKDVG